MNKVCVLGLGYIGLPTASVLATHGFKVIGVDVNEEVIGRLKNGEPHIKEPGLRTLVEAAVKSGNLVPRTRPEEADAFIIAVPTPVTPQKRADLSFVRAAAKSILPVLRRGNLVVLESTCPPGTTREFLVPILAQSGLAVGEELFVAYCPERVLPGNILKELIENRRIIGGITGACAEKAREIYARFVEGEIYLTDATTAEMVKLCENTFRDVNIALANEIAAICEKLGVSAWEVIRLANLHPRVSLHLPGPGVGGHCLAVDPWFLAEGFPEEARLIALARRINDARPLAVVARLQEMLDGVARPKVAVLGVAYKGNVDDTRESPALAICRALEEAGISFSVYDPHVKSFPYELVGLSEAFSGADCALVVADHAEFRYLHPGELGRLMRRRLLFDTRNCLDHALWRSFGFEVSVLGSGGFGGDGGKPARHEVGSRGPRGTEA